MMHPNPTMEAAHTPARRVLRRGWHASTLLAATLVLALLLPALLPGTALAATLTVNDTGDAGDNNIGDGTCRTNPLPDPEICTLRAAIQEANFTPAADKITFAIVGTAPFTIAPTSQLPEITAPLEIDGGSPSAGVLKIIIDGTNAGANANGLRFGTGAGSNLSRPNRLSIINFKGSAILIQVASVQVTGCYIGLDAAGTTAGPNGTGIRIESGPNVKIGGDLTQTTQRNVIAGNTNGAGILITGAAATGNTIQGNYIGTNLAGTAFANKIGIQIDNGATDNTIGGGTTDATLRTIISGNTTGVLITGAASTGNLIRYAYIGTNAAGDAATANTVGVQLEGGATTVGPVSAGAWTTLISGNTTGLLIKGGTGHVVQNSLIGTSEAGNAAVANTTGARVEGNATTVSFTSNTISGNTTGLELASTGVTLASNRIGTNAAGSAALANTTGVSVVAANVTVGNTAVGTRNIISGNSYGVDVAGVGITGVKIVGNYIGLNSGGTTAVANTVGVRITNEAAATIGGLTAAERNIISGNGTGIQITSLGTSGSSVVGNYIGTNPAGDGAIGNTNGVQIDSQAAGNTIGGTSEPARNIISGNSQNGVYFNGGSNGNFVQGNWIGVTADGADKLGNQSGVRIESGASGNTIGGTAAGAGNVISGNQTDDYIGAGVRIVGASTNVVVGNFIGTGTNGTGAIGNDFGVLIFGSNNQGNLIGGTTAAARNVISGNRFVGVTINDDGSSNNAVKGNYIGVAANGTTALGNGRFGVRFFKGEQPIGPVNNTVGGSEAGAGNLIANNNNVDTLPVGPSEAYPAQANGGGVVVEGGSGNQVLGNTIVSNTGLGIRLLTGANGNRAAPVLTAANGDGTSSTAVAGTLAGPAGAYRVEFFVNDACDASGSGEGQSLLGFANVTISSSPASFNAALGAAAAGKIITATATDANGNSSAFSNCATVTIDTTAPQVTAISRAGASPTGATTVSWAVTFTEPVIGVKASNFQLVVSGLSGAPAITGVTGSGTSWTVTASTGSGNGTLGVNMVNGSGVTDLAGNSLTGTPLTGQVYTIDTNLPSVNAITRVGTSPTSATTVSWLVTFNKAVVGVKASNFQLVKTGLGGTPAITSVTGSGTNWTVTASTGSGNGTLGLNMVNGSGVTDTLGNALGGVPLTGQVYTIDRSILSVNITPVSPDPRTTAVTSIQIVFSSVVVGFDLADLKLTRNGANVALSGATLSSSDGGKTWTLGNLAARTNVSGNYVLKLTASGSGISSGAKQLQSDASEAFTVSMSTLKKVFVPMIHR